MHPDHPLELALERFRQNPGLLPVLSRSDTLRVEGVITLETIMQFSRRIGRSEKGKASGDGVFGNS